MSPARTRPIAAVLLAASFAIVAGVALRPAVTETDDSPSSDLDYWLDRATTAPASQPTEDPDNLGSNPLAKGEFVRSDALPGAMKLSDGTLLAGGIYTTREKPWRVYVASEKRWRRIPPLAVLSITAKVIEEKMELEWRWKSTGEPEKVYTGRKYPTRRLEWRFLLIDGSEIVGVVKGQPIWVESPDGETHGPLVLHERSKGEPGQSLGDLVYVKKAVLSRKMMKRARAFLRKKDKEQDPNSPSDESAE